MAELLGEEWSGQVILLVVLYGGWDSGSGLLSSSPLAWWCTDSFSLSLDTGKDFVDIISDIRWSTEVLLWNQR